jgi:uncharacterized protein YodC (DUF2158 family)
MSKSINDFKVGDKVYHLSNKNLIMVVIEVNTSMHEITCRWVDNNGRVQVKEFMPEELGDSGDLAPRVFAV